MIKGINKQIIEIKCTNNEYFDKILLFVKGEKADSPSSVLQNQAVNYCRAFTGKYSSRSTRKLSAALAVIMLAVLGISIGAGAAAVLL